ncbi:hypothetical protein TP40_05490 [Xanthomonas citri pv. citri]|nr:hypothetical protein TP40_05490 [Xanthomonas citri pv. citri]
MPLLVAVKCLLQELILLAGNTLLLIRDAFSTLSMTHRIYILLQISRVLGNVISHFRHGLLLASCKK